MNTNKYGWNSGDISPWGAFYVLHGHEPVPASQEDWSRFFRDPAARRVASTVRGPIRVSTVFLGMDHCFAVGPPLLFESMVFVDGAAPDPLGIDQLQVRTATWDEAEAAHRQLCELAWGGSS